MKQAYESMARGLQVAAHRSSSFFFKTLAHSQFYKCSPNFIWFHRLCVFLRPSLMVIPREDYQVYGTGAAVKSAVKAVPIALLRPMIALAEASSKTLLGDECFFVSFSAFSIYTHVSFFVKKQARKAR
jgi:hypothetical protein